MLVPAFYFDGKTSRKHAVSLTAVDGMATISGEAERQCRLSDLRVSERLGNTPRKVTFPDGAYLEILDSIAFDRLLRMTGHRDSWIVRIQQSWCHAIAALGVTVGILLLGYEYGLPAASKLAAQALPPDLSSTIGQQTLAFLDENVLEPSELPLARQKAILARFSQLSWPQQDAPPAKVVFRKSRIGPNAFALPSGHLILTDQLVNLLGSDEQIMSILSHEAGHLHHRHMTRRVIETSVIGALSILLFGDASGAIANLPAVMLDLKFSRDGEREADDFAIVMLKANGIDPAVFAHALEKLKTKSEVDIPYLSTHPSIEERISRARKAH